MVNDDMDYCGLDPRLNIKIMENLYKFMSVLSDVIKLIPVLLTQHITSFGACVEESFLIQN